MIPPPWRPAAEAAAGAPLTVVIGPIEAGKTTLTALLANDLAARGHAVAILDADLGQSEIGPPTTIGLGRVVRPLGRLADAQLIAMHFVGATSPAANVAATLVGVRVLADRARAAGFTRLLVDTSGLVRGELGRTLKQAKIALLDADLLVALQRGRECEHILAPYRDARPAVVRVAALPAPRRRSAGVRRRRRAHALRGYFAAAPPAVLDLTRVVLRAPPLFTGAPLDVSELQAAAAAGARLVWGERRDGDVVVVAAEPLADADVRRLGRALGARPPVAYALSELEGVVAGLENGQGHTVGLAVVRRLDVAARRLHVETPAALVDVKAVVLGRERFPE